MCNDSLLDSYRLDSATSPKLFMDKSNGHVRLSKILSRETYKTENVARRMGTMVPSERGRDRVSSFHIDFGAPHRWDAPSQLGQFLPSRYSITRLACVN